MAIHIGEIPPPAEPEGSDAPEETRRRRDPEATRKAILDAAEHLFVCHGPNATSLSRIAKHADVTKSLIHHHFGSKEELWQEVQQRHFQEYFDVQHHLLQQETGGDAQLLEESLVAYFRFLQRNPDSVRFFTWTLVEGEGGHCPTREEKALFELGIQRIRESQERGEIRADLEPFFIIKTMISMPMAWFQTHDETRALIDSDIEPEDLDEMYLRDLVKIFLQGVRPRPEATE